MATQLPALLRSALPAAGTDHDPEAQMGETIRRARILLFMLVFVIGGMAAFIPIGGAVIGAGQVGVESRVKQVAHPLGGTIKAILVRNGQHVKAGQILLRLDDRVTGADAALSSLSADQMLARQARLEAEQLGAPSIAFPPELASRTDAEATKAMADERALFAIRRSEEAGMAGQLDARIQQREQEIASYQAQIAALAEQARLIEPERQGVKELWDKKLVTIGRVNQIERTAVDLQGRIAALRANIAQAQAGISEAREQRLQMGQTRRAEAGDQLTQLNASYNQQRVRSVSATDAQERSLIRAPYDGIVDKLAFSTVGGVIRPAETILEIVPDQDRLIVEAAISPADIDQVRAGQHARIRFTSMNSTATPEVSGRVVVVAPERTTDKDGQRSYFAVRVQIDPASLARAPEVKLKVGVPAEIFIETGSRTMLSYLTKPLRDQLERAFRDN
jgi:HlyD family secretion protein